jgi:hypothetical protein
MLNITAACHKYIYMDRDEQTKNNQDDENTASGQMYEIQGILSNN